MVVESPGNVSAESALAPVVKVLLQNELELSVLQNTNRISSKSFKVCKIVNIWQT
jgi:hypothetical protein